MRQGFDYWRRLTPTCYDLASLGCLIGALSLLFPLAAAVTSPLPPAADFAYTQCVDGSGHLDLQVVNSSICASACNQAVIGSDGRDLGYECRMNTDYPARILRYFDAHDVTGCWDARSQTYVMGVPVELFSDRNWTGGVLTIYTKMLSPACLAGDWLFELSGGMSIAECSGPEDPVLWSRNVQLLNDQMHINISEALGTEWDWKWDGLKRNREVTAVKLQSAAPFCRIINETYNRRSIYRIYAQSAEFGEANVKPIEPEPLVDIVRFRKHTEPAFI